MDLSGILIINKPPSVSSHFVVNRVRRIYGTRTVGHCGTLDPMATGVLPVMVGRAVKAAEYLKDHNKSYRAGLLLGLTTDSGDITGKVTSRFNGSTPSFEDFAKAAESFKGSFLQTPPMYSALKVNGVKLVKLARQGIEVRREAREITIHSIRPFSDGEGFYIDVDCTKGTYIRTLCEDIGALLGCGATMNSLVRTRVGDYGTDRALTLEQLAVMDGEGLKAALIPVETLFLQHGEITLPLFYEKLFKNGCEIYFKKLRELPADKVDINAENVFYRVRGAEGFIALAKSVLYPDGMALKSVVMFQI